MTNKVKPSAHIPPSLPRLNGYNDQIITTKSSLSSSAYMCVHFHRNRRLQVFFYCLFISIFFVGDPNIRGIVGIPLTSLTPPRFCARSKPRPEFATSYGVLV